MFVDFFIINFAKGHAKEKLYESKDQIAHIFLICLLWWFIVNTHY